MGAISERLREVRDRLFKPRDDAAKLERAQRKARAEAQRREHQREDFERKSRR